MSHKQKLRPLLACSIIVGFIFCLWGLSGSINSQNLTGDDAKASTQGKISVPVTAKQLDPVNRVIPISLKCQDTILIVPDILDKIPCTIKNDSGRVITALVLGTSVSVDSNGTISTETAYTTIDTFIHGDFHINPKKSKGIKQNAEPQFPLAAETYDGVITQVQVYIDFVEFDDKETSGPNKAGARILTGIRDGAEKYKSWLVKEFELNGKSDGALVRLIAENQPIPVQVGISSASQEEGAVMYRNWLLRIRNTDGVEELKKIINHRSAANH